MTTTNWIFANVCYFILFIVDFPAYVVDNWTCEDTYLKVGTTPVLFSSPVSVSVIARIRDTLDLLV